MKEWVLPSSNFEAVVAVQLAWLLVVATAFHSLKNLPRYLLAGLSAGLPLGLFFDLNIGRFANIFYYSGLEQSHSFLIVNGILSYGIAITTVLAMGTRTLPRYKGHLRRFSVSLACLLLTLAMWLPTQRWPPLAAMFILGALVLAFSEAVALLAGGIGYLAQLVDGRWGGVLRIWIFSILTGTVYEVANSIFPVWAWVNGSPSPEINLLLIVLVGYLILFLPIFTAASLLHRISRSSRADAAT